MSEEEWPTQAETAPDADDTPTAKVRAQPADESGESGDAAEAENAVADEVVDAPASEPVAEPGSRIAEMEQQLAKERDAANDYMQRWQRAQADFANFRRRQQQEQEQHDRQLMAQALAPVLLALDSFERAFQTVPESLRFFSWIEGIALIDLQLRRALNMYGVQPIPVQAGEPLDPLKHQAVGEVETDEHPAGTIADVVQRGYQFEAGDMVLRPALVQVAKPQAADRAAASGDAAAGTAPTAPGTEA